MTGPHDAPTRPIVCGHRGAASVAPENTMAGFATAADRGATWVEFDVRPTVDRELIIHHDPVTADGMRIASAERSTLDSRIPSFAELATSMRHVGFDVEMKTDDIGMALDEFASLVISELDRHCRDRDVSDLLVTSFDIEAIGLVRRRRPDIATGLLVRERGPAWAMSAAVDGGHQAIAPWFGMVTPELVGDAHDRGLSVATWTVNEPASIVAVADAGVDMIIGDDPAVIVAALRGRAG